MISSNLKPGWFIAIDFEPFLSRRKYLVCKGIEKVCRKISLLVSSKEARAINWSIMHLIGDMSEKTYGKLALVQTMSRVIFVKTFQCILAEEPKTSYPPSHPIWRNNVSKIWQHENHLHYMVNFLQVKGAGILIFKNPIDSRALQAWHVFLSIHLSARLLDWAISPYNNMTKSHFLLLMSCFVQVNTSLFDHLRPLSLWIAHMNKL